MRVLVTGASGFLGSFACAHLEAAGHVVIRAGHFTSSADAFENILPIEVSDPASCRELLDLGSVDAVVHCAGIAHRFGLTTDDEFLRVNVEGVSNVAKLAIGLGSRQFVHISSVLVYGKGTGTQPITEETPPHPDDLYSMSKLNGERAAIETLKDSPTRLVILRPAPIVGEGGRGNVARLIHSIDTRSFRWIGNGTNRRSFVYVGDVARAIEFALLYESIEGIFNVVGGSVTLQELVHTIAARLERRVGYLRVPRVVAGFGIFLARPFGKDTLVGRYRRLLEAWLASAVYSGRTLESMGFVPQTSIVDAVHHEVDDYTRRR